METAITTSPIDPAAVLASVGSPADGAVLLFLGTVREQNEGRPVRGMRYDAYIEMAEQELARIGREAAERAGSDRVAVVHRIGELEIGAVSVAIAVSTPHRAEAFDAARYVIEQIKERLPVWKREHYRDGDAQWLAGKEPPVADNAPPAGSATTVADSARPAGNAPTVAGS
jgi:molybdopterin synthase catalytic subunit